MPEEVGFVAHSLEKEILEQVAGFEVFTVVEQCNAANEPGIGGDVGHPDERRGRIDPRQAPFRFEHVTEAAIGLSDF